MESSLINSKGYKMSVQTSMRALTDQEIDEVSGSGYFAGAAAGQVRSQQPLVRRHALLDLQHLRLLSLD